MSKTEVVSRKKYPAAKKRSRNKAHKPKYLPKLELPVVEIPEEGLSKVVMVLAFWAVFVLGCVVGQYF